jgi:hypothetical protein
MNRLIGPRYTNWFIAVNYNHFEDLQRASILSLRFSRVESKCRLLIRMENDINLCIPNMDFGSDAFAAVAVVGLWPSSMSKERFLLKKVNIRMLAAETKQLVDANGTNLLGLWVNCCAAVMLRRTITVVIAISRLSHPESQSLTDNASCIHIQRGPLWIRLREEKTALCPIGWKRPSPFALQASNGLDLHGEHDD